MIDKKKIQCQIRRLVKRKSSVKSESKQSSSVVEAQEKKWSASIDWDGMMCACSSSPSSHKEVVFFLDWLMNNMAVVLAAVNGDSNFVSTSPVAVHPLNARRTTNIHRLQ